MAGGPRDWARNASRRAGMIEPVTVSRGGAAAAPAADDDPIAAMIAEEQRLGRLQTLQDMRADRESAARRRRLENAAEEARLQRIVANGGIDPMDQSAGAGGNATARMVTDLTAQLEKARSETVQLFREREQEAARQQNAQLTTSLDGIRQMLQQNINQPPAIAPGALPGEGPIQTLVRSLQDVKQIQTILHDVAPPPEPPPIDPALSAQQKIDLERAELEAEIRRIEKNIALETIQFKREELKEEMAHKRERLERLAGGLENALAPILAAAAGGALAHMFGGGDDAPAPGGGGNGAGPAAHAGTEVQMIHYVCPQAAGGCGSTNWVPLGTTVTSCPKCKLAPIQIAPPGAPAPG
jgi:hypothetical protein